MSGHRMRFDGRRYIDCRWCRGQGCLACEAEASAAYKRAFPDGPKPIATFDMSKPEEAARAKAILGGDALKKAFGPGGEGLAEILRNIEAGKDTL